MTDKEKDLLGNTALALTSLVGTFGGPVAWVALFGGLCVRNLMAMESAERSSLPTEHGGERHAKS